jgi:hypothetical protein
MYILTNMPKRGMILFMAVAKVTDFCNRLYRYIIRMGEEHNGG